MPKVTLWGCDSTGQSPCAQAGRRAGTSGWPTIQIGPRNLEQIGPPTWLMGIVWYRGRQSWLSLLCDLRDVAVPLWAVFPL